MNSTTRLMKLAARFEAKINKFAGADDMGMDEDPKAVTADAFFGPPANEKNEQTFKDEICKSSSNFIKCISEEDVTGTINIGARVDVPAGVAEFIVSFPGQKIKDSVAAKVKSALMEDYKKHFGSYPKEYIKKRIKSGENKIAKAKAEYSEIITL